MDESANHSSQDAERLAEWGDQGRLDRHNPFKMLQCLGCRCDSLDKDDKAHNRNSLSYTTSTTDGTSTTLPARAPISTVSDHTSSKVKPTPRNSLHPQSLNHSRRRHPLGPLQPPRPTNHHLGHRRLHHPLQPPWLNYFVYSCFSASLQSLCIAPLTSPSKIAPSRVLTTPTASWEKVGGSINEGPQAMYHGGKTFLAYSASYCWTSSYALGLLTWNGSGDPALSSSWRKTGRFLTSANGNYGPGHNG